MEWLRFLLLLSIVSVVRSGNNISLNVCSLPTTTLELKLDSYTDPSDSNTKAGKEPEVERWYIRESDGICTKFAFKTYALNLNVFSSKEKCRQHGNL